MAASEMVQNTRMPLWLQFRPKFRKRVKQANDPFLMTKCRLKLPNGHIVEGSISSYVSTAVGTCVHFMYGDGDWGVYPVGRIIPTQLTLF
jgi:hypothetical protein